MSPTTYSAHRGAGIRDPGRGGVRMAVAADSLHSRLCWATEKHAVPPSARSSGATRARPWAMSPISMSREEGRGGRGGARRASLPRAGALGRPAHTHASARAAQGPCRWQPTRWSFTIPTACMKAWMIVGPQKENPSAFNALPIRFETSVFGEDLARLRAWPWIGRPSQNSHRKREKPGPLSSIRSNALAPAMVRDLRPVADDARVGLQPGHVLLRVAGDDLRPGIRRRRRGISRRASKW